MATATTEIAATKPKLLTADDLLRLYSQGVRGELIRGVLRETTSSGQERGELATYIGNPDKRLRHTQGIGQNHRVGRRRSA